MFLSKERIMTMPTDIKTKQQILLDVMKQFIGRKLLEVALAPIDKKSFELTLKFEGDGEVTHIIVNTFDILVK